MTKSTGAMALRHSREELFSGEMSLRRALLHTMSAIAWACRRKDEIERKAQSDAYDLMRRCHGEIVAEQMDLK